MLVLRRAAVALLALAAAPAAALAQNAFAPDAGGFDPAVPAPEQVLGYPLGARFTPHHLVMRYLERVAAASPRVRVDTLGRTFEGREVVMAIVTSEANHARLDEIRAAAQRLAHPGAAPSAELDALAARTPAIAWLGYTVHGNEASGVEAALGVLHHLAAANDAATRAILDSVVVLIDPVQNPDGHERHAQDVMRRRGALGVPTTPGSMVHQGTWPGARTSHYHFDLNRDWFLLSHPESRARVGAFTSWWPHVAADLHEMGSNSTYFFAPPMEPVNPNVPQSIIDWWDVYAASNAAAFDAEGWSYFRREGYDEFYPGYGVSWPTLTGAVGMTYEQASSGGGAIRRADGTVLTLREAALHHYVASLATLRVTAQRRTERVRDYVAFRRSAISEAARPYRAIVIGNDGQGRADSLAQLLVRNGIVVSRLTGAAQGTGTAYGATRAGSAQWAAGSYVVDLAQPQGRLAKALLEPDAALDSAFIREELESRRTGRGNRFYDITGWSLPFAFRVDAWTTNAVPGGTAVVAETPRRDATATPVAPQDMAAARYGYAFEAGSETSLRLLGSLLASGVRVAWAPRAFTASGGDFPRGAFVVRAVDNTVANATPYHTDRTVEAPFATPQLTLRAADTVATPRFHEVVRAHAALAGVTLTPLASALVEQGTDLGSNSVATVRAPRVALLGGDGVQGNSFGFTWYAFDQRLGYPTTAIDAGTVAGGILRDFDVLVIPSASAGGLDGALGEGGRQRLAAWVRDGGVLITLDGATSWLARESVGLSAFRAATEDDSGGFRSSVPGAIVRAVADTLSPLLAGVHATEVPILAQSNRVFAAPRDVSPGTVVLRHAAGERLRLAGYLWPESPARLAESPVLWTERAGRGRVIAFTMDPNFRDLWRGMLPVFANAVFLGGTF